MVDKAEGENKFNIVFGQRAALKRELPPNTILIVPDRGDWNDFGHRTGAEYKITVDTLKDPIQIDGYIGFIDSEGHQGGKEFLEKLVSPTSNKTIPAPKAHNFFTMLPEMGAYRLLVSNLGPSKAIEILSAANDLVTLSETNTKQDLQDLAIKTETFSLSFMRSSQAYFAFKNAGTILRGLSEEKKGVISNIIGITFKLPGCTNPHDLKFKFDHDDDLPKRIAIIIGKNGVGKSQALSRIAKAAINGAPELTDGTEGGRPNINRLLAFAPTNETESAFPNDKRKNPKIWYGRYSLNRSRRTKKTDHIPDLIIQLARSKESIASKSRWDIFIEALSAITSPSELYLPVKEDNSNHINIIKLRSSSEMKLLERYASIDTKKEPLRVVNAEGYPLSSGEISFLKFAAQVSLHIENGSLLLFDEPETHLHPNFISRFIALLDGLLKETGSSAIIATHSAYFVKEVFREQVSILNIDSARKITIQKPSLRTFGADVGAISYFVFGEDEPSKLAEEVESKLISRKLSWKNLYENYKDELSLETLNSLRAKTEKTGDA